MVDRLTPDITPSDGPCSFCGKHRDEVKTMIAGKEGVFICDECVAELAQIVEAD